MARILIPDTLGSAALAAARALHRRGDTCDLAAPSTRVDRTLKGRSVAGWHQLTSPHRDGSRYVEELVELCRCSDYDVVLPPTHLTAYLVSQNADRLESYTSPVACDAERFRLANDKVRITEHARRLGIACPSSYTLPSWSDADDFDRSARFPLVVKARGGSAIGLLLVEDLRELREACVEIAGIETGAEAENHSPFVQEFVPGPIHDVCLVAREGEVVGVLTQRRDLMAPISGGVGAVVTSTDVPEIREQAIKLVESLGWTGPAQIEFKYDERDSAFKFIELNPRLWGTLAASVAAGMDFPGQLRDLALGLPVTRRPQYRVGVTYRFLFYRGLRAYLQVARTFGSRQLLDEIRSHRGGRLDIDVRDPLPDLHRIGQGGLRFGREALRRPPTGRRREIPLELAPLRRRSGGWGGCEQLRLTSGSWPTI